jgi:chemotaxis protein MotB
MMASYISSRPQPASIETDQNYLASAADLMIGLLFVFIIMVAFLALQKKAEQEARAGDRDPRGTVTMTIGEEIRKSLPSVKVDPASGVITLPEELLFDLGSSVLKESAVEKLGETSKKLADVLKCFVANQIPKASCQVNKYRHEIETIFIEGHTDNRPMNRVGGNVKLSLDRAISVNAILVQGTNLAGFRNQDGHPIFSYSAYAESRPLIKADPSDGRNRRVDLRIVLTYRPPDSGSSTGVIDTAVKN